MSLAGILLGLINVAIVVAILVLIGLVIVWFMGWMGLAVPPQLQKVYMVIVALIGLYMLVALLLGIPTVRIIGGFHAEAIAGRAAPALSAAAG
jgi:hypothetical protein